MIINNTISTAAARRFYNRWASWQIWVDHSESRARNRALDLLAPVSGQRILNAGVGTGQTQAHLQAVVAPTGTVVGLDLSPVMLHHTCVRIHTPLCEADVRHLPFVSASFDGVFSSFVLDLLPFDDLAELLQDFQRVLKPDGRIVLVSLTEGINASSRLFMALWKLVYRVSPIACGGCRPLQLAALVSQAGFCQIVREVVVQLGMPSEIVAATRC